MSNTRTVALPPTASVEMKTPRTTNVRAKSPSEDSNKTVRQGSSRRLHEAEDSGRESRSSLMVRTGSYRNVVLSDADSGGRKDGGGEGHHMYSSSSLLEELEDDIFTYYTWSNARQSSRQIAMERHALKESIHDSPIYRAYAVIGAIC